MRPASLAVLLALLCAAPLLAGCITPTPDHIARPRAEIVLVGGVANQQVTVDPVTRQANELSIAVNPTNPLNIIATGKDYTQPYAGDCVWDGIYVSHDGGATWKNDNLVGSPWKARADAAAGKTPELHQALSRFYCATDPVVAFGPDGSAYWAVMPYQCDTASGSTTGAEAIPPGGLNDWFWTCSAIYVLASHDGGDSWPTVTKVAFGPRLQHDKMWLSVGPATAGNSDGLLLLCWDQDAWLSGAVKDPYESLTQGSNAPPYPDDLYIADQPVPTSTMCATSRDQARTWTSPAVALQDAIYPWVDFSANGTAFMAAVAGKNIVVLSSQNGLDWSPPTIVGNFTDPPNIIMNGFTSLDGSAFRTFALPAISVDRSAGLHEGNLYVTWMDAASGQGRTMFTVSRDGGVTWMPATWIHELLSNDESQRGDQFMPSVSAGPDGTVDLSWCDRRADANNHLFDTYYAFSLDGGATFSEALRVSNVSSDEQYSHHQNGAIFLGDYRQTASSWGQAHPVWVDTRNHKADVYTATIARPSANAL